jgi:large subunit ribosomal protein L15e
MSKHSSDIWKKPKQGLGEAWKQRLMVLRREPTVRRLDGPTRPERARSLGYKAKQGFVMARVGISKGKRKDPKKGRRRPKRAGRFFTPGLSLQGMAEQKAGMKFPNCEVLNSYWLAEDGNKKWYEVILIDRSHPSALKGNEWAAEPHNRGRAFRGLTSAGKKSRGLRRKGFGAEKARPSAHAAFARKMRRQKKT